VEKQQRRKIGSGGVEDYCNFKQSRQGGSHGGSEQSLREGGCEPH
jgi:hypothetical protein